MHKNPKYITCVKDGTKEGANNPNERGNLVPLQEKRPSERSFTGSIRVGKQLGTNPRKHSQHGQLTL